MKKDIVEVIKLATETGIYYETRLLNIMTGLLEVQTDIKYKTVIRHCTNNGELIYDNSICTRVV